MERWIIGGVVAYLLGAIPSGLLLSKLAGLGDVRKVGSGNIGATNVLRAGNKAVALLTLLADFAKAWAAVTLYERLWMPEAAESAVSDMTGVTIAATLVVLGHMFPVWLRFRGGKGVACLFGCLLALMPALALAAAGGWLLVFGISRISALGALVGMPLGLGAGIALGMSAAVLVPIAPAFVVMVGKHHGNIRRLLKGEERRLTGAG